MCLEMHGNLWMNLGKKNAISKKIMQIIKYLVLELSSLEQRIIRK